MDLERILGRHQDGLLRPAGWELKNGTAADNAVSYGYDTAGRLQHIDPSYPLPASPQFTYGFEPESNGLIKTVVGPVHTVTNTYETNRNVLKSNENAANVANEV